MTGDSKLTGGPALRAESSRQELLEAVEDLRLAATERISLAHRVRENPMPWLIGGFLVGLWLGSRGP